jgi:isoleucyl-tRNA synthetase
VTQSMDGYDVVRGSRTLMEFVSEISTWYLRQSRERLKGDQGSDLKQQASHTFGYVLYRLAQLFAPVTPFFSEVAADALTGGDTSIHLSLWPTVNTTLVSPKLEKEMALVQEVVERCHAQRRDKAVKVRQPLAKATVTSPQPVVRESLLAILQQEVNIKAVEWQKGDQFEVALDLNLTNELREEGLAREVIRQAQQLRKAKGVAVDELVDMQLPSWPATWEEHIKQKAKIKTLTKGEVAQIV